MEVAFFCTPARQGALTGKPWSPQTLHRPEAHPQGEEGGEGSAPSRRAASP